jgi:hypothetical protein
MAVRSRGDDGVNQSDCSQTKEEETTPSSCRAPSLHPKTRISYPPPIPYTPHTTHTGRFPTPPAGSLCPFPRPSLLFACLLAAAPSSPTSPSYTHTASLNHVGAPYAIHQQSHGPQDDALLGPCGQLGVCVGGTSWDRRVGGEGGREGGREGREEGRASTHTLATHVRHRQSSTRRSRLRPSRPR